MKCSLYMNANNTANHRNCIPSPPTFTGSVDGNFHAFPWFGDYYLIFERICVWHTPFIYHIWTIARSRLINWLGGKVKAGQLTWCEGQGWTWHIPLTSIDGRKWTLGKSRLITWPFWPVCPIPSVWSQVLKWQHTKSVLNILTMCI